MTRINTNVSALLAEQNLNNTNNQLSTTLTRLSTGLRINTGADDPSGLIAASALGSEINNTQQAISNSQVATQMVSTADSALGQISSLLQNIRGLVTQSASTGSQSSAQIAANQLQVDSSLSAIDRIAQTTAFQGQALLNGQLDFQTAGAAGTNNFSKVSNLAISQATLGTNNQLAVNANVTTAATQAKIQVANVPAAQPAVNAYHDFTITSNASAQATGTLDLSTDTIGISALAAGEADGVAGNNIQVKIVNGQSSDSASYSTSTGLITVNVVDVTTESADSIAALIAGINSGNDFSATANQGGSHAATLARTDARTWLASDLNMTGGAGGGSATIRVSSSTAGVNTHTVQFATAGSTGVSSGNLTVRLTNGESYAAIANDISSQTGFTAQVLNQTGYQSFSTAVDSAPAGGVATALAGGGAASGGLGQAVTFSLTGNTGTQVLNFLAGTSMAQLVTGINAVSGATGVQAKADSTTPTTLDLLSTGYGSAATAAIKVISEGAGAGGTFTSAVGQGTSAAGTDVAGTINGVQATGQGNTLSVNTADLGTSMNIATGFTGNIAFNITGGGALFQLGANVNSNNQARIGIQSVGTDSLGGSDGLLYQIGSSGTANLTKDPSTAANIVDEASSQVTSLRGRLGAFQQATLDTNIASLTDAVTNLTAAQSSIQDADFAAESASLTREQILVQSGTSVLSVANKNPENVLSLLH